MDGNAVSLTAIHIISHGSPGNIHLGKSILNAENMSPPIKTSYDNGKLP
jgi:hypothetical protein